MAAGLSIPRIQEMAGEDYPVIRIMPNTPASVGEGMIQYCSSHVTAEEEAEFCKLMAPAGRLDPVPEALIDAASCVSGCGMPCFACCHNSDTGRAEYFDMSAYPPDRITDILTASTAIPAVFPAKEIGGIFYRDGGLSDNTPIKPLYDIGFRKFIVSYLGSVSADLSEFPDADFLELYPSDKILLGKNEGRLLKAGTLDFDGGNAALRIELGRTETLEYLSGNIGTFFRERLME